MMTRIIPSIVSASILATLISFWTTVAVFRILFQIFRHPLRFFCVKRREIAPKCLMEGWNHSFVELKDVRLHYVHAGGAGKPLMLLLHGFPEFWYSWRNQINEFSEKYRVVAIDMRGYGESDKPQGKNSYAIKHLVDDVKQVISKLDHKKCTLVGHDWGGIVAWNVALAHPEIVDKLIILNSPHPRAFQKLLHRNLAQMLKSWYLFFFQCPILPEMILRSNDMLALEKILTRSENGGCSNPNAFKKADIEAWKYMFGRSGAFTPPMNYYRAAMSRMSRSQISEEVRAKSSNNIIQTPTLIIWGDCDLALHNDLANMSANYCHQAEVQYIEGASHWVQQDEPQEVNAVMWRFLRKQINILNRSSSSSDERSWNTASGRQPKSYPIVYIASAYYDTPLPYSVQLDR